MTRIALIHALAQSVPPINQAFARLWPEATLMNLLDDSLSADVAKTGLDACMHQRFMTLADYAVGCGSDAILYTCSAFGPCIEAVARKYPDMPVLKPNEAMIAQAARRGKRIGLVATFAPTLASMPAEFPGTVEVETELAAGALDALNAGDAARHDELAAQAAGRLQARGCDLIALAQFSLARAAPKVAQSVPLDVLTTVDSAVELLREKLAPGR
ncbi:MAG TPA: aspartate/glutamate racemase family protein [Eoetvoesiella sp.]|mgnify:CR=1 FL=1|uniref:aspartate/glutamate racemase family protein n=1 Tax=Eoetvoesiella sp. TaxID=1966355 RepID=UPI002C434E5F|nr:aspartate/glutamate racemase family protein [Eoetvoesiella sp.]HWK59821.1 aspartate/glutamate racemase family protein [Eoetvoesiella sp.]